MLFVNRKVINIFMIIFCIKNVVNGCAVPTLCDKALDCLLDRTNIEKTIQKLDDWAMLSSEATPSLTTSVSSQGLLGIRAYILNLSALRLKRVSKVPDCSGISLQMSGKKQGFCKGDLLVTARNDGKIELIDTKTRRRHAVVETGSGAFSCITSAGDLLATSKIGDEKFNLWSLSTLKCSRAVKTFLPLVFMQFVDNNIITVNTAGCVNFYDSNTGREILNLKTGIGGTASIACWDSTDNTLCIETSSGIYFVSLNDLILFNRMLSFLRIDQLVVIAYIFKTKNMNFVGASKLKATFDSLPELLKKSLKEFFK